MTRLKKIPVDLRTLNPREAALAVLQHFQEPGTDADRLLHELLRRGPIKGPDARLATELVFGVLRRRSQLDGILSTLTSGPWNRTPAILRDALRLGAYQILHTDRIPDHAAVNETVRLAKEWGPPRGSAMVNAVLRRLIEQPVETTPGPPPQDDWPRHYSHPAWLVRYLLGEYPPDRVAALLNWNNNNPALMLRANRLRVSAGDLADRLAAEGCKVGRAGIPAPEAVEILGGSGDPASAEWLEKGLATVQDAAAQLIAHLLAPKPGERIVDWCAAPGGKTTHLAELCDDRATILALDADAARLAAVKEHAGRLGLTSIQTHELRPELVDWLAKHPADAVLVDAPCTGLGTIQRHPDIRWRRKSDAPARAARLQAEILDAAARAVATGGRLVYCTCTLGSTENEQVVERFLERHRRFARMGTSMPVAPAVTPFLDDHGDFHTWPPDHRMDGFYAARLIRHS